MAVRVRLGVFSPAIVAELAIREGIFAANGLEVTTHPVASSPDAFRSLHAGELDVLVTSPDNVIAYRFNTSNPLGGRLDTQILRGLDRGLGLSLIAAGDVATVADLRGADLAVDAPKTGFAFALYALMAQHGMADGVDYRVTSLGVTPRRRAELVAGRTRATMLNAGSDLIAEERGCRRLVRVSAALGPYLGSVLAAPEGWSVGHPDRADALLSAWADASRRVVDPEGEAKVRTLVATMLGCSSAVAHAFTATLADPDEGLVVDGGIDQEALQTVLDLRTNRGGFDWLVSPTVQTVRDLGLLRGR